METVDQIDLEGALVMTTNKIMTGDIISLEGPSQIGGTILYLNMMIDMTKEVNRTDMKRPLGTWIISMSAIQQIGDLMIRKRANNGKITNQEIEIPTEGKTISEMIELEIQKKREVSRKKN